ncbi:MAG TPA: ribosome maturation factor RimM [Natronosporangium sp.]
MLLTVGQIVRPHGVRGEVLVEISTDEPAERYAVGSTLVTDRPAPKVLTVEAKRPHQGRLIVAFKEVADRNAAEALRGVLLQVDSEAVPPPADPDEFLDHQLIGLSVVDRAGQPVGELVRIDHAPASDLLVVARPGARTALVPFRKEFVPEVDLAGGRVVIDPPPGLLDL